MNPILGSTRVLRRLAWIPVRCDDGCIAWGYYWIKEEFKRYKDANLITTLEGWIQVSTSSKPYAD